MTTRRAAAWHPGYLTAISVGEHSGYDRVVFTFSQGLPGYTVGYVNEVLSDPKGDAVALPGQAFLRVVFHPSSGYQTYAGPGSITPVYPALLQVRAAGDFESYTLSGSGLAQLDNLVARDVRAVVVGSGLIRVTATARLNAAVPGTGAIIYSGNPLVTSSVTGTGSVTRR